MKKLTKKQKIQIGVATAIIVTAAVVGTVVGLMAAGAFDRDIPGSGGRTECDRHAECIHVAKPIVYLYPEETTEVAVTLGTPEKLTASYPLYNDGWHVLAEPDGKLTDLNTGRELYSLYYEGDNGDFEMSGEGFVVPRTEVVEFLEEKLAILGLNEREAEEFIIYWLPKMQENEYNYVRFATSSEIETYMPLSTTPSPKTVIRILMLTKGLEEPIEVQEQKITPAGGRDGFTVVEWGGGVLD